MEYFRLRNDKELYWLAGLVEGEASIQFNKTPSIIITMTDKDVIERARRIFGPHATLAGPYWGKMSTKECWRVSVCGQTGAGWLMTLWTLMGERRRAQIEDVLAQWKARDTDPRRHKGLAAKCHPERPNKSRGMCSACYQADRKLRLKAA